MPEIIYTHDGATIECDVFGENNRGAVILIAPAMGVRASFYRVLAEGLVAQDCTVMPFDLRGIGGHSERREQGANWHYQEMIVADFAAAVTHARRRFEGRPLLLLGHSLGGQLGCLFAARNPAALDGVILAASCMVDWRGWGTVGGLKRLLQYAGIGLTTRLFGYFPGEKIGFAGNEPRGQMKDWVRSALTGRYQFDGADIEYEKALAEVSIPILALTFHSDTFAPAAACDRLLLKMPRASAKHLDLSDADVGLKQAGHFQWARQPAKVIPHISDWLHENFG